MSAEVAVATGIVLPLTAIVFKYAFANERRLTRVETKVDMILLKLGYEPGEVKDWIRKNGKH